MLSDYRTFTSLSVAH